MAFEGQPPFDKNPHDTILSADWNLIGTRLDELDDLNVNLSGDDMTGPLTIAGALNVGTNDVAEDTLHVRGSLRIESASPALIVKRTANTNATGLQIRNSDDNTVAHIHASGNASPSLRFRVGPPNAPLSVPVRMSIDNDGDVGIGTTSIADRLHAAGGNIRAESTAPAFVAQRTSNTGRAGFQIRNSDNNSVAFISSSNIANANLDFRVGPANATPTSLPIRMTIDNDGNLGVGDSNPEANLHVQTSNDTRVLVMSGSNDISSLDLFENLSGGIGGRLKYDGTSSNIFSIGTFDNGTESLPLRFRRNVNRVGVLTDDPKVPLHIMGGNDVTLADNTGYLLIGDQDGSNLVMDNNEIQARNNGSNSTLFLNNEGGSIGLGGPTFGPGADFAEMFESTNGKKIPAGTAVVLEGGKVRAAKKNESPMGVATETPGNLHGVYVHWPGKYLRDAAGAIIKKKKRVDIKKPKTKLVKKQRPKMVVRKIKEETVKEVIVFENGKYIKKMVPEVIEKQVSQPEVELHDLFDEEGNLTGTYEVPVMEEVEKEEVVVGKNGEPVMVKTGKFEYRYEAQLNPAFDPEREYVSRLERDEWNAVALMGQVVIRKGQPVADNWVKMWEVSPKTDMWLIK